MAAGAPAAFQSENTRVRPPIIDVFHVRSSSTARHTKCNLIPGKLGVDLHRHRVHIPLVQSVVLLSTHMSKRSSTSVLSLCSLKYVNCYPKPSLDLYISYFLIQRIFNSLL